MSLGRCWLSCFRVSVLKGNSSQVSLQENRGARFTGAFILKRAFPDARVEQRRRSEPEDQFAGLQRRTWPKAGVTCAASNNGSVSSVSRRKSFSQ